ncbi:MAG TPA: HD domain-containing protein, partial [Phycisphaerales bacterium]|nr:HD domain-containing protein [Phycisphaerales bacterium]
MTTKGRLEGDVRKTGAAAAETLRGRCADLGLPSWRFDQSLRLWSGPCETGKRAAWLASGPVTEAVGAAVAAAVERSDAEVVELGEGCWLIVLAERYSRRRTGSIAVMALGAAARTGGLIASGAAAAGADAETVWADLAELAVYDAADIPRLRRALMWMRDDLCQQYRDRVGLEEFGNQLTEMYEEIGLLYRLGRSMNRLTEPVQFVTTLCDDLVQTLPFQWVAARFADSARVAPALAGHLALAGSAVGRAEVVGGFAAGLIGGLDPSKWTLLREEDHPELAGLTGTGVLAHPISREREVVGVLLAGNKRGPDPEVSSFETQLLDAAADYLSVFTENAGLYADQHAVFVGTIRALTASIDAKDRYTRGHSERVAHLARQLARAAGLDEAAAEKIHISGLLHDVGKIGVPEAV